MSSKLTAQERGAQPRERVPLVVERRRDYASLAKGLVTIAIVLWLLVAVVRADVISFSVIAEYMFSPLILKGAWNTIVLAIMSQIVAFLIGILTAATYTSRSSIISWLTRTYVWAFRGTPLIIQLLFWFNAVPAAFSHLRIEVPVLDILLIDKPTTAIMTSFMAAFIGLSLNEGAYYCEILRSGIRGVGQGQWMAARAIGLTRGQIYRRVVFPQAFRITIPAASNQFILLLKTTALAYIVGYGELLYSATRIYSDNFRVMELLIVASIWFLVFVTISTWLQSYAERKFVL